MVKRWNQLKQSVSSEIAQQMNPAMASKRDDPVGKVFQSLSATEIQGPYPGLPVPFPPTLPMHNAPIDVKTTTRRIIPIPVIPQGEVHKTSAGTGGLGSRSNITGNTSGTSGATIDLRSETTAGITEYTLSDIWEHNNRHDRRTTYTHHSVSHNGRAIWKGSCSSQETLGASTG